MKIDRKSPILIESASEGFEDSPRKINTSKSVKRKHADSAGDDSISSSSESEIEETKARKRASPKRRCIRNSNAMTTSMQDCASLKQNLDIKSLDSCIDVGNSKSSSSSLESDLLSLSKQSTNDTIQITNHLNLGKGMSFNNKILGQHDSGISSQEAYSSQEFCFANMKPAMLKRTNAQIFYVESSGSDDTEIGVTATGKNYNTLKPSPLSATSSTCSEASIESGVSIATLRQTKSDIDQMFSNDSGKQQQQLPRQISSQNSIKDNDDSTICSVCFANEKSAVFVHTKKACSGCCYTCAMKTWKKWKSCPFCKEKAKNVIKLYSH